MNNKTIKKSLLALLGILLLASYNNQLQAQDDKSSKKKVVIVTKKVDEQGNEVINKEVLEGEDAENFKLEELDEAGFDDVDVNIEDNGSGKIKRIIKIRKDVDGEQTEEIEIENDGTLKIVDKDGNITITEDFSDEENMEIEKTVEVKDGVITETIIKRKTNPNKAFLGVALRMGSETGVAIDQVIEDSPAEKAGLKSGDLITHINKVAINSLDELTKALAPLNPGDTVAITYQKDDIAKTTIAVLEENKGTGKQINVWKTEDGEEIDLNGKAYKIIKKTKENKE